MFGTTGRSTILSINLSLFCLESSRVYDASGPPWVKLYTMNTISSNRPQYPHLALKVADVLCRVRWYCSVSVPGHSVPRYSSWIGLVHEPGQQLLLQLKENINQFIKLIYDRVMFGKQ